MISKKFIRYGVVGAIGATIHLALLVFLVKAFSIHPIVASSAAFLVTVIVSYCLNYTWTFQAQSNHATTLARYITVCLIGFCLNAGIMFIVVDVFQLWYLLGQAIATVVIPISNFILNSRWAFKQK